jgi:hypothetical protein
MNILNTSVFSLGCILTSLIISPNLYAKPDQIYKPYKNTEIVENIQPRLYKLKSLNVNFSSRIQRPEYMTQDSITELYKEKIEQSLKEKNMLADATTAQPIDIDLAITQKRIFAGEAFGQKLTGNYAHSELQYNSTITYQNSPLASYKSEKYIGIGDNGTFGKMFRDLSGKGKPEHEIKDVEAFAEKIVEQLPK